MTPISFGERLLEIRKKKGFSQSELAGMLNTQAPVIGRYERGETTPSVEVALKLSKILGVSLDYLAGKTELELDESALKRMQEISKMTPEDQSFILRAIDALVRDFNAQKAYSS